jgi:hypothetical protein
MNKWNVLVSCAALALVLPSHGQVLEYKVEMNGAAGHGDYAPFWHTANRFGLGSVDTKSGYVRAGVDGMTAVRDSAWKFTYGLDLVTGYHMTSTVLVQQAFGEVQWKALRLSVGQKERDGELKNQRLSTGALIESGNARPVPQVRLEMPEFWYLPLTNDWFAMRAYLAYGMFMDGNWQKNFAAPGTRYAKHVRYHTKALFLKGGNERKFPLTLTLGLQMDAEFGGTVYNYFNQTGRTVKMKSRLIDYWRALVPGHGDNENTLIDQLNIEGNQLGSWHLEIGWKEPKWGVRAYYEHMFEDHSGTLFKYGLWKDGMGGIEVHSPWRWVNDVVAEYFYSRDQSGPIYHDSNDQIKDQISSCDNYYVHGEYPNWQTYGMIIGSPMALSPIYNKNGRLEIYNNRVTAYHLGWSGAPADWLVYRAMVTKMNGWGTYGLPYTHVKHSTSCLLEVGVKPHRWKEWQFTASGALDRGGLYGDNVGLMVGIIKRGIIK